MIVLFWACRYFLRLVVPSHVANCEKKRREDSASKKRKARGEEELEVGGRRMRSESKARPSKGLSSGSTDVNLERNEVCEFSFSLNATSHSMSVCSS